MHDQSLIIWNENYLPEILGWHKKKFQTVHKLVKVDGFADFNHLIDINRVFSSQPRFMPIDRTGTTKLPFRYKIHRPWQVPQTSMSLDEAMQQRVQALCSLGRPINLMWSGGIDSTAVVTAFLKHAPDFKQLRLLYSPWSLYEHPMYMKFLKKFPALECRDISGTVYLTDEFDGIIVTGEGGDEITASLDESFIETYGMRTLNMPWKDFFYQLNPDDNFIEFCHSWFAHTGRPIETVLQARWAFYAICKIRSLLNSKLPWLFDNPQRDLNDLVGFFDCEELESFMYFNIEQSISGTRYNTWKQIFKDYCHALDGFEFWRVNKTKFGSLQMIHYTDKKIALKNQHWLAILDDGTRLSTPSLPVLTRQEYQQCHDLEWLFNTAD